MKQTFFLKCTQLATTTLPLTRASIFCKRGGIYWEHKVIPERMRSKISVGRLLGCTTTVLKKHLQNINIIVKNWTNQVTNQKPTNSLPVVSQKLQVLNGFEITGTSAIWFWFSFKEPEPAALWFWNIFTTRTKWFFQNSNNHTTLDKTVHLTLEHNTVFPDE